MELRVIDLFAGCGGFGTGMAEAGLRVVYANELDRHARASYQANHPDVFMDPRRIEIVKGADILGQAGRVDVVIGGPPCQPFSLMGLRTRKWDGTIERLGLEFIRITAQTGARAFVMENVPGLAQGASSGWFRIFIREMGRVGYRVAVGRLNAADYGVPQERVRLIFLGVRDDLDIDPQLPTPAGAPIGVADVLPHVEWIESYQRRPLRRHAARPMPTLCASDRNWVGVRTSDGALRALTLDELKVLSGFPGSYVLAGPPVAQRRQLGNCVPPPFGRAIGASLRAMLGGLEPRLPTAAAPSKAYV